MRETTVKCSKCGHKFAECAVRHCPHPAVKAHYDGEDTHICIYCCRGCEYGTGSALCGAMGCSYKTERSST